jgi:hypothetical protein
MLRIARETVTKADTIPAMPAAISRPDMFCVFVVTGKTECGSRTSAERFMPNSQYKVGRPVDRRLKVPIVFALQWNAILKYVIDPIFIYAPRKGWPAPRYPSTRPLAKNRLPVRSAAYLMEPHEKVQSHPKMYFPTVELGLNPNRQTVRPLAGPFD